MKLYNYILLFTVLGLAFQSCRVDDSEASSVTNLEMGLISLDESFTTGESAKALSVDFQFDENQIVGTTVNVEVDPSSTATEGVDFTLSTHSVSVPAYVRDGSFTINIIPDLDAEGDETILLNLTRGTSPFGINGARQVMVTLKDSIYTTLELVFDWEGEFQFSGSTFTKCPNVDLDFYMLDAEGNDLGIYDAATGACPESIVFDDTFDDGTYFVAASLWENGLDSLFLNVDYTTKITAAKGGVFREVFQQEDFFTSEDEDTVHDGVTAFKPVVNVTKAGNSYTVKLPDGTVIAQGFTVPDAVRNTK